MAPNDDTLIDWLLDLTTDQLSKIILQLKLDPNSLPETAANTRALAIWQQVQQDPRRIARLREIASPELQQQVTRRWFIRPHSLAKNFTGRYEERRELTKWLMHGEHPLLFLTGDHNAGKTELAWAWMIRDVLRDRIPDAVKDVETSGISADHAGLTAVYWWRFDRTRESSFGHFLEQCCKRLQRDNLIRNLPTTDGDRVEEILETLRNTRMLLLFDEFENETLYRPRQALDVPLDPARERYTCYDPCATQFFQSVASTGRDSRVLATCPFVPNDLDQMAGCHDLRLRSMTKRDALDLFRAQGVEYGHQSRIFAICERFFYHAGNLRDVSVFIASRGGHPDSANDFTPDESAEAFMFEALSSPAKQLLKLVSLHQSPMDYSVIKSMEAIVPDDGNLDKILEELAKWNILWQEKGLYRLNRRFASYARRRLVGAPAVAAEPLPDASNRVLLASLDDPDAEPELTNESDLEPIIKVYRQLVAAGEYQGAWNIWKNRLNAYLYYRFGAYHRCIDLLEMLEPKADKPTLNQASLAWLYNSLANACSLSGQMSRSVRYFAEAIVLYEAAEDNVGLATALANLADDMYKLGRFSEAHDHLDRMLRICEEGKEANLAAYGHQVRGTLYTIEGQYESAVEELNTALDTFRGIQQRRYIGGTQAMLGRMAAYRGDIDQALEFANQALDNARWKENRRDLVRAFWLLGFIKLVKFERENDSSLLDEASRDLDNALTQTREISLLEFEPDVYMTIATHAIHNGSGRAVEWMTKASKTIEQSGYVLKQCQLSLLQARIAESEGDRERAGRLAEQAMEQARFDGGRFVFQYVTEEAAQLRARCGPRS